MPIARYRKSAGVASQILYLAIGIAGLPVFALSPALPQGAARLLGPTGGYRTSYPFAAFLTGLLAERGFDCRYLTAFIAMLCGLVVVFTGGVSWLMIGGFATRFPGRCWQRASTRLWSADFAKLLVACGRDADVVEDHRPRESTLGSVLGLDGSFWTSAP